GVTENVLRKVQTCSREPLDTGHLLANHHRLSRAISLNFKEVPYGLPKAFQVLDRPAPELIVIFGVHALFSGEPLLEFHQSAGLQLIRTGSPQNLAIAFVRDIFLHKWVL